MSVIGNIFVYTNISTMTDTKYRSRNFWKGKWI